MTYLHIATHIRGRLRLSDSRVLRSGTRHYWWEVVNTRTGEVIKRSDGFGFSQAVADLSETVASARAAWFWSWRQKDVA